MWKHNTRKTKFCLCVDNFGIQYHSKADANHLIQALTNFYDVTIDWSGKHYCDLTLDWDYENGFVDISMPGYITNLLTRLKHPPPAHKVDAPHAWIAPKCGQTVQHAPLKDMTPLLSAAATGLLQSAVGSLLFYARAVDPSMLPGLNEVSVQQSKPTKATQCKVHQLLDYVASHSNVVLCYHASAMVLHIDSDAAYLVLPKAKSRIAGHYYLSNDPTYITTIQQNGPILTKCRSLCQVVASSVEAETSALFHIAQNGIPIFAIFSSHLGILNCQHHSRQITKYPLLLSIKSWDIKIQSMGYETLVVEGQDGTKPLQKVLGQRCK